MPVLREGLEAACMHVLRQAGCCHDDASLVCTAELFD